jgi:hypothetical protein
MENLFILALCHCQNLQPKGSDDLQKLGTWYAVMYAVLTAERLADYFLTNLQGIFALIASNYVGIIAK